MFGPIERVVFDLDGTLVDTMSHVVESISFAIKKVKNIEVPRAEIISKFAPSTEEILSVWFDSEQEKVAAIEAWGECQGEGFGWARPFEGVEEMLSGFKKGGVPMAIFTGRNREGALGILAERGWLGKYFDEEFVIGGTDGFAPKPSGAGLLELMLRWKLAGDQAKKTTLYVGDHTHDLVAGREAGVRTALALWDRSMGLEKTERSHYKRLWSEASDELCDVRLSDPRGLLAWLEST
ncbi:HAD family hydrolase [bacterium]|nr:HAD family hydrolase [bacterium]